jgi:hypothetical protein
MWNMESVYKAQPARLAGNPDGSEWEENVDPSLREIGHKVLD